MSICSDVEISREKAEKQVADILWHNHKNLINKAVKGMSNAELTSYLHTDLYFYSISGDLDGDLMEHFIEYYDDPEKSFKNDKLFADMIDDCNLLHEEIAGILETKVEYVENWSQTLSLPSLDRRKEIANILILNAYRELEKIRRIKND